MTDVSNRLERADALLRALFSRPSVPFDALLIVTLLAHGYEIFSLHLTIDEEVHLALGNAAAAWLAQARWGMALLSLLLPSSIVPVVSSGLGLLLLAVALWLLSVKVLDADRCAASCVVSVALTLPSLPFTMSFTTLAYGVGFGALAAVMFILWLHRSGTASLLAAASSGAFAISVYQPLVFALLAMLVADLFRTSEAKPSPRRAIVALAGSAGLYLAVDHTVRRIAGVELHYVGQFVDVKGLLEAPGERLIKSFAQTTSVWTVSERLFSLHAPGLAAFLLSAIAVVLGRLRRWAEPGVRAATSCLIALLLVPVLAQGMSAHPVPLRSSVYLPFVLCTVGTLAFRGAGIAARLALVGSAAIAVVGNAAVDNRLYAAASFAYERDRLIAHDIVREAAKLSSGATAPSSLPLEVVGRKSWPQSPLIPTRETLGASFMEWDDGNRHRIALLLGLLGFPARGATTQEVLPLVPTAREMPSWPQQGWVRREHDVLIVKLSPHTPVQRGVLCTAGASDLCD